MGTAFRIGTWNVAGLRALQKKDPEAIGNLIQRLKLDVLCIQEHKLQEAHLTDPKVAPTLPDVPGYTVHYSCSTAKKGYSGTACFIKDFSSIGSVGSKVGTKKKAQTTLDAFVKPKSSTKSTAAIVGLKPGAVYTRVHRVLASIKARAAKKGFL